MATTVWPGSTDVELPSVSGWSWEAGTSTCTTALSVELSDPTSVALADVPFANVTLIELHISNVHAREEFRHHSYISPAARGIIVGLGVKGYPLAIEALVRLNS